MGRKPGEAAPRLIQRAELVADLDLAAEAKVTLISAPAGSGKTSLLRAWADGPGRAYRLASSRCSATSRTASSSGSPSLPPSGRPQARLRDGGQLAATPDFNEATVGERVLAELAEHGERTFLVIDDLHELTSAEALLQLARLLERLPPHVHAILATRRDLPLRMHKLRLSGDLAEIRAADLRFSPEETRELLNASGVALSDGRRREAARAHGRLGRGAAAGRDLAGQQQ